MADESTFTVLIVPDGLDNSRLPPAVLRSAGYTVLTTRGVGEAVETARRQKPHVIVSYATTPDADGAELCRAVRADPQLHTTPILLVGTNHHDSESADACLRAGADGYLEEPFDPARLITQVSRLAERKACEQALEESERRYRMAVESIKEVIFQVDCGGRWTFLNPAWTELTGFGVEESIGRRCFRYVHPEDRRRVVRALNQLIREKKSYCLEEVRYLTRGGDYLWVKVSARLVRDDGDLVGASGTISNIAERKQVEQALRESEERYRQIVENARDMIITHDLRGNYTSVNRAALELTGYTLEETLAMNFSQALAPEYVEKAGEIVRQKLAGVENDTVYELELVAKDGRRIAVEVNSWLVYKDGQPVGVQAIGRDITARRLLENQLRQSQKMEAIGRLAGGVAHDFNNILTAIIGYSDLALRRLRPEDPLRRNLSEIRKSGERAAGLTRQLLAFSRQQILLPRVISLNEVVAGIEGMLRRLIGEDVELKAKLDPSLGNVKTDPGQIEQVIMNLAVNARDAMPQGGRLTIKTRNAMLDELYGRERGVELAAGPYVMLAVSDTGMGMDEATRTRAFEPFFTTKPHDKGTGLGLSTVYGIVKQSGGYVWVYSEPGRGATFEIYLPRVDEAASAPEDVHVSADAPRGRETILLVEDEEAIRSLTGEILTQAHYEVLVVAGGEEAISLAARHPCGIDLLLTDVVMPGTSGRELADRLGESQPEMRVLYMSGYTDDAVVRHGMLEPGLSFVQKPFTLDSLLRIVRDVLDA